MLLLAIGNVKFGGVCPASRGRRLPTTKRLLQVVVCEPRRGLSGERHGRPTLLTRISQLVDPAVSFVYSKSARSRCRAILLDPYGCRGHTTWLKSTTGARVGLLLQQSGNLAL